VAYPSITRLPYELIDDSPISDAPEWLIALAQTKKNVLRSTEAPVGEIIPPGTQDAWLISQAGVYRARGDNEAAIFEKLKVDVLRCPQEPGRQPYTEADFKRIAMSVCNYPAGLRKQETTDDSFIIMDKKGNLTLDIAKLTIAIMNKATFAFMLDNDTGFYYENGVYKENAERFIATMCQRLIGITPILTEHKINEIIGHIRRSCYHDRKEFNPDPSIINVKNGLLNVLTGALIPHTPDYLSNVQNPVEYNPRADCPAIKKFLIDIHNSEDISTVQELLGYLLLRDNRIQKAFLGVGGGENGKSTEQRLIEAFLGPDNCSHKSWQQLETDRFASSGLEGKLVNLFADLPSNGVDTTTTFKMLTGSDGIDAQRKFKDSYSFISFAKLIFSTNKPPKVENEDSYAFWRRWIILEYPRQFTDADKKPNILQEITTPDELSGLLNYALEGLKRLLTNNKFSYGKSVDEVTEYYMQAADPVYAFASSAKCELKSDAATLKDAVYDAFKDYCGQNKMPILKPNAFARSLQNQPAFHIRATKITVNGVRIPAWQGIKLQESVQDVQDVHDISHFNQSRADAGINITKVEKNTDNPDNPDKKQLHLLTNAPKRLKSLDNCPDCGSENIGAWPDGSDGYYCMDCFPNFNEEVD
jgi:putative DNA primase/helicase